MVRRSKELAKIVKMFNEEDFIDEEIETME